MMTISIINSKYRLSKYIFKYRLLKSYSKYNLSNIKGTHYYFN